jgi:colanic acid biosynthesis glycosyl transferase WcaI
LQAVQNSSDVSIVSLRPGTGTFSVPSKVLGYMAAAKPVVASVDPHSETACLIQAAGCGKVVPPGDAQSLAEAVRLLIAEPEHAAVLGRSGRAYLEANFGRTQICSRYLSLLQRIAS